jgi:hypothetical protein
MTNKSETTWQSCRDEQCRTHGRCMADPAPCSAAMRNRVISLVLGLGGVVVFVLVAFAAPPPDADPALHEWFERQYNVNGGWCCKESDGHILSDDDWRIVGVGYEVRIDGTWYDVPATAYRDPVGGPNPTQHAIAWWSPGEPIVIYCFTPGTLT